MADAKTYPLEANQLYKSYDKKTVINNVSFHVARGECLALLGPNGAGKTTICEMIEGLVKPDSGHIFFSGESVFPKKSSILERIGVQLQETSLYKKYTVTETLELFASFYRKTLPIEKILSLLELQDKKSARIESLSGGQKQRVYLGCALINDPEILFLDEPTTGLDPQARRTLWDLLALLKKEGRSLFLTTHYMEEAAHLADRIAILDKGHIIALGTTEQLIREHCGSQVLRMMFKDQLKFISSLKEDVFFKSYPFTTTGSWVEFSLFEVGNFLIEIMSLVKKHDLHIEEMEIKKANLEDVFLKLTGRSIKNA